MEYNNFDEYIKFFKEQSTVEKRDIIYSQLKLLASLSNKMCEEINVKNEIIVNKELLDINDDCSEDDYLEAIVVLVNSIQESLCDFDLKLTDIMEKQTIDLS